MNSGLKYELQNYDGNGVCFIQNQGVLENCKEIIKSEESWPPFLPKVCCDSQSWVYSTLYGMTLMLCR
jgi:hypothetical protein